MCIRDTITRRRTPAVLVAALLLVVPVTATSALAELVIVAHREIPAERLDLVDLERIYLGKTSRWTDGTGVAPAMLRKGPAQEEFVEDYLGRPLHRFVTYWRQMVFTGKGIPPRTFADEAELLEWVAMTPGAVGYARPGADISSVKVLGID